ncbi:glycosyl hydrolase [Pseudomonas nicosulfuronedens]|uniref:Glycosyl hydrolase n=1 Tax=Pseudomonas nicosulfuronedens TaxID=2571105 RepID=A0A5R9QLK2_9PSED|nr:MULTISPECIES: YCF48-related protein [Pseudomonas]TLX69576.1 glycosyl hydrolase [Pseudomonas nicosulfuronedens]
MPILYRGLVALVLVLCAGISTASADFVDPLNIPAQPSNKAQSSILIGVTQTPGGRWVAVGRRGHIIYSDDTKSWKQASVPVSVDLVAVQFPTAKHGWAVGHGGIILHSSDSGQTWTKQLDGKQLADLLIQHWKPLAEHANEDNPSSTYALQDAERFKEEGPGRPFLDVHFTDEKAGYAVGAYNLLLRTDDGGTHWQVLADLTDNPSAFHFNAVQVMDGSAYLVGEQGLLLKEDPESHRFTPIPTPYNGTWFGLVAQRESLLLFGLRGSAYLSHNRGQDWTKVDTGTDSTITSGILLPDGRTALASADGELLISQSNESAHFERAIPFNTTPIYGLAPVAGEPAVVAVGADGIKRIDFGLTPDQSKR